MKFTEYILALMVKGELSKEAALEALELNKEGSVKLANPQQNNAVPLSAEDLAKYLAIQMGVSAGVNALGTAAGGLANKVMGKFTRGRNDALFQQMMGEHPALQGKDPARAKANFDYLLAESPNLAEHPLILGDHVANMTSMGTSDLATTKTIADIAKSKADIAGKNVGTNFGQTAGDMAGKMYLAGKTPQVNPADLIQQESDKEYNSLMGKALARTKAFRYVGNPNIEGSPEIKPPTKPDADDVAHFLRGNSKK